jgi:tRNA nucleotidyltransferase (CCA-adding enzyme)
MEKLHGVKAIITGSDLLEMGVTQGPLLKKMLDAILDARLNGKASSREDEIAIVRKMQAEGSK